MDDAQDLYSHIPFYEEHIRIFFVILLLCSSHCSCIHRTPCLCDDLDFFLIKKVTNCKNLVRVFAHSSFAAAKKRFLLIWFHDLTTTNGYNESSRKRLKCVPKCTSHYYYYFYWCRCWYWHKNLALASHYSFETRKIDPTDQKQSVDSIDVPHKNEPRNKRTEAKTKYKSVPNEYKYK